MTGKEKAKPSDRRRKIPKPATPERLEKAALAYLERFATSSENLRRVLARRVHRSAQLHGTDRQTGLDHIDGLIERYQRAGLLDDMAFACNRAASLSRAGNAKGAIRQKLRAKGVPEQAIENALMTLDADAEGPDADLLAALRYARRRRFGPFGTGDPARKQRDMAALARRGFSLDLVRLILEAEDEASLADRLTDLGVDLHDL